MDTHNRTLHTSPSAPSAPMMTTVRRLGLVGCFFLTDMAWAGDLLLLRRNPDPYGWPRPAPNQQHIPIDTSLYLQVGFKDKASTDAVLKDSMTVRLGPVGAEPIDLLSAGQEFAEGCDGRFTSLRNHPGGLSVYIDPPQPLKPSTTYIVSVQAKSDQGDVLDGAAAQWRFTTVEAPGPQALKATFDLSKPGVRWHGGFFTGFCKPSFCTSGANRMESYELIDTLRKQYPKAFSLVRDVSPTGVEYIRKFPAWQMPNIVRERQTRRIISMEGHEENVLLRVEDFFGHQQYGIESNRPLDADYRPQDQVLIADGVHSATTRVLRVIDDEKNPRGLLLEPFPTPEGGWNIDYRSELSEKENPSAPGLFPSGGCYLYKFKPVGDLHYYWGRLDQEWDISHRRFGRRLVVNFCEAPGDLSVDGRNWTHPKDYAQHHEAVHAISTHVIERYGDACLDFYWSVFNEPDLASAFWRSKDWNELQTFYDYTVDAVLRAFEDQGYDSGRVMVGGLEIGGIFGVHIERPILQTFLTHCSPAATGNDALPKNAAYADPRLDGKRSKRVEQLCRENAGQGSPCDFVSVHSYNASPVTAAKLIKAKDLALEIDPDFYADLWVNSFESCPGWAPPPDLAANDSYLGNGYFSTWCADVIRRQLAKASEDARFGFGETILTFWPWPNQNFRSNNNATRLIHVDEDGDGEVDRKEAVAMQILNFLAQVSSMGEEYWVLPDQTFAGTTVSGFASRQDAALQVVLYAHNPHDIQSRSDQTFKVDLHLGELAWPEVAVTAYRYDKRHNSYYELGRTFRDRREHAKKTANPANLEEVIDGLSGNDPDRQIAAVQQAAAWSHLPERVLTVAMDLHARTRNPDVLAALEAAGKEVARKYQESYSPDEAARVKELSILKGSNPSQRRRDEKGGLTVSVDLPVNGARFIVIEPVPVESGSKWH